MDYLSDSVTTLSGFFPFVSTCPTDAQREKQGTQYVCLKVEQYIEKERSLFQQIPVCKPVDCKEPDYQVFSVNLGRGLECYTAQKCSEKEHFSYNTGLKEYFKFLRPISTVRNNIFNSRMTRSISPVDNIEDFAPKEITCNRKTLSRLYNSNSYCERLRSQTTREELLVAVKDIYSDVEKNYNMTKDYEDDLNLWTTGLKVTNANYVYLQRLGSVLQSTDEELPNLAAYEEKIYTNAKKEFFKANPSQEVYGFSDHEFYCDRKNRHTIAKKAELYDAKSYLNTSGCLAVLGDNSSTCSNAINDWDFSDLSRVSGDKQSLAENRGCFEAEIMNTSVFAISIAAIATTTIAAIGLSRRLARLVTRVCSNIQSETKKEVVSDPIHDEPIRAQKVIESLEQEAKQEEESDSAHDELTSEQEIIHSPMLEAKKEVESDSAHDELTSELDNFSLETLRRKQKMLDARLDALYKRAVELSASST